MNLYKVKVFILYALLVGNRMMEVSEAAVEQVLPQLQEVGLLSEVDLLMHLLLPWLHATRALGKVMTKKKRKTTSGIENVAFHALGIF